MGGGVGGGGRVREGSQQERYFFSLLTEAWCEHLARQKKTSHLIIKFRSFDISGLQYISFKNRKQNRARDQRMTLFFGHSLSLLEHADVLSSSTG